MKSSSAKEPTKVTEEEGSSHPGSVRDSRDSKSSLSDSNNTDGSMGADDKENDNSSNSKSSSASGSGEETEPNKIDDGEGNDSESCDDTYISVAPNYPACRYCEFPNSTRSGCWS